MGARRPLAVLAACSVGLLPLRAPAETDRTGATECPAAGDAIVVLAATHELWLCAAGETAARYAVALGRGGVGKRRRGDGRTPLGTYPVGAPRASARYGTFIPIAYPTAAQTAQGFTGDALGIHGPPRGMEGAEYPVTEVDWTLGCIATGTDGAVRAIAEFVRARRPRVHIR